MIFISRVIVYSRILQFYSRCILRYKCYSLHDAIIDYNKVVSDLLANNLFQSETTLPKWRSRKYKVIRSKQTKWYFAYYELNGNIYIVDAENVRNMKDNANTSTSVNIINNVGKNTNNNIYIPLKAQYYNGLRIGYNRSIHKYNILNMEGQSLSSCPLDKVKFFKKPFGKYNIIAHANINGQLWAMGTNGQFYDMHKTWKDAYLGKNEMRIRFGQIISEVINSYLNDNLLKA